MEQSSGLSSRAISFAGASDDRLAETRDEFPQGRNPIHLVFSAHSVPASLIESGDPYQRQIESTVKSIMQLGAWPLEHTLCYQSKGYYSDGATGKAVSLPVGLLIRARYRHCGNGPFPLRGTGKTTSWPVAPADGGLSDFYSHQLTRPIFPNQ